MSKLILTKRHILRTFCAVLLMTAVLPACNGKSKNEFSQEGRAAVKAENFQGAVVLFRSALEKDPNDFKVRVELADAYMQLGKYNQAQHELQKVKIQAPGYVDLPLKMGELNVRMQHYDKAVTTVRSYLEAHPKSSRGYEILGWAFVGQGDQAGGEKDLRTALSLDEKNQSARLSLARLLISGGRQDEGQKLLVKVVEMDPQNNGAYFLLLRLALKHGRADDALGYAEKILATDPSDPNAFYYKGVAYLEKNDFTQAAKVANILVRKFPDSSKGWQLRGIAFYHQKQDGQAISDLLESLKHQPDLVSYYFLGLAYSHATQYELALNQFQKVLDYRPDMVLPRIMVAVTLLRQHRDSDAAQQARIVLKNAPRNGLAHNILGSAYLAEGRYKRAMDEFDRAIDLDPKLVDAHLKKGLYHMSIGKFDEAEEEMGRAVAIAPELLNTRLILANYYMRQQKYQAAASSLKGGLRGQPVDAVLYDSLADIAFIGDRPEQGKSYLLKAQQANPAYLPAYFHLASYYLGQNAPEKAIEQFRSVLARDPKNINALLSCGIVYEMNGEEAKALSYYRKAKDTGKISGALGLLHYYSRKGEGQKLLATLDEELRAHQNNLDLLGLKGRILENAKRYNEAAALFEHMESVSPGRGYPQLIDLYLRKGDAASAYSVAQRVIKQNPASAYGYQLLGALYEEQGKPERALEAYEQGLSSSPGNRDVTMAMARLAEHQHQLAKALQLYQDVEKRFPDYYPAIFADGSIRDRLGDKKKAVEKYRAALALSDTYVPALNNLAYVYADSFKANGKALNLALMAYRRAPFSPAVLDTLGYVLLKNGRVAPATKVLARVANMLPDKPSVLFHLAMAYREGGHKKEAIVLLKKTLTLGDFPESEEATKLLAELNK